MNRPLYLLMLVFLVVSACATNKRLNTDPVLPRPVAPEVEEIYACSFGPGTFEGILPCFGNDCTDAGAPLTTLKFDKQQKLIKYLGSENGRRDTLNAQWSIGNDCIIEIRYSDSRREFFRFHPGLQKIELLNVDRRSFPGTLNKHHFISKIK